MKQLPNFKNDDEERKFWLDHDSCDYFDLSKAVLIDQKRDMPLLVKTKNLPILEKKLAVPSKIKSMKIRELTLANV